MIDKRWYNSTNRHRLVQALEMLVDQPNRKEEANRVLGTMWKEFRENPFSLDSIVLGGIVHEALDSAVQSEAEVLCALRDQLMGVLPDAITYAIKHKFSELLQEEAAETYGLLRKVLPMMNECVDISEAPWDRYAEYEDMTERLHELCYEKLLIRDIPDLLIAQASHALLLLPYHLSESFDLDSSSFSRIGQVSGKQSTREHLRYIEDLLEKLEGEAVLFVDVHLLPEGYVINLR